MSNELKMGRGWVKKDEDPQGGGRGVRQSTSHIIYGFEKGSTDAIFR